MENKLKVVQCYFCVQEHSSEYDIYLSYCEEDKGRTEFIIQCLKKNNANITVFSKLQELDMYESWQEQLYNTITSCKRVIALITPAYLMSTSCSEQYNIALCLSRKLHQNFLIPFYLSDVSYMPTYMEITQYIDCRYKFYCRWYPLCTMQDVMFDTLPHSSSYQL